MRSQTKSVVGILSIGVIAASYQLGAHANESAGIQLADAASDATVDANNPSSQPTSSDSATTSSESTPSISASPQSSNNNAASSKGSASSTAAETPAATSTTKAPIVTSASKTSSPVNYKYGTVQLEVFKTGSKITDINLIQASTEGREYAQVPSILVQAALSAQGSNFGNVSRATFVTNAFKQALDDALAKF